MDDMPRITLAGGERAGPTLVCLPGAMCSPHVFAGMARLSGFPALALAWLEDDGPHDLVSIAARVSRAITDLPSVILVGHSMGTPIAMLTALQEAESGGSRIHGLVLSNSGANTRGHGDIAALIDRIRHDWNASFWDAFIARCFHTPPSQPLLEQARRYPGRLRQQAVIDVLSSQQEMDFLPLLARLSGTPVAVIHGRHDPARTIGHARELADGIAGAQLHVFDTGHTSCAEDPGRFAEVLRETFG
ncbi:alpha/beta hydrolase [Robbsia sp. Bb-Pol-6]|uniref:Alpha/beta hydrolase n=1 Tax=Robbsia betulipollinis TaxID=2981849 RepID=A0ABT3ZKL9_9BURK|nr:alpha/beta hydrolase [Robbsia betulipollinis]MCY0386820.1 alpha/beta hydrolase [Robbsia betulipollinis]